jgi:hypothetical protein
MNLRQPWAAVQVSLSSGDGCIPFSWRKGKRTFGPTPATLVGVAIRTPRLPPHSSPPHVSGIDERVKPGDDDDLLSVLDVGVAAFCDNDMPGGSDGPSAFGDSDEPAAFLVDE